MRSDAGDALATLAQFEAVGDRHRRARRLPPVRRGAEVRQVLGRSDGPDRQPGRAGEGVSALQEHPSGGALSSTWTPSRCICWSYSLPPGDVVSGSLRRQPGCKTDYSKEWITPRRSGGSARSQASAACSPRSCRCSASTGSTSRSTARSCTSRCGCPGTARCSSVGPTWSRRCAVCLRMPASSEQGAVGRLAGADRQADQGDRERRHRGSDLGRVMPTRGSLTVRAAISPSASSPASTPLTLVRPQLAGISRRRWRR